MKPRKSCEMAEKKIRNISQPFHSKKAYTYPINLFIAQQKQANAYYSCGR